MGFTKEVGLCMFNFLGSIPAGIFLGKKYSLGIFGYRYFSLNFF